MSEHTISRWAAPLPQGNTLNSVWIAPWGDVITVGEGGTLMQSSDSGEHWNVRQLGRTTFNAVWGPGDDRVYVLGERGQLLVSRDRGREFAPVATGTQSDLYGIAGRDNEIYIAASDAVVLSTRDGGASWVHLQMPPVKPLVADTQGSRDINDLTSVTLGDNGELVTVAYGGVIYSSKDHGKSWKELTLDHPGVTLPEDANSKQVGLLKVLTHKSEYLILTENGVRAGGTRQEYQDTPSRMVWSPILSLKGNWLKPWSVNEVLESVSDISGEHTPTPPPNASFFIDASDSVVIVGEVERKLWASPRQPSLHDVPITGYRPEGCDWFNDVFGNDHVLFAVGSYGIVQRSFDKGQHWQDLRTPRMSLTSVWAEKGRALAMGRGAWTSEDDGRSWNPLKLNRNDRERVVAAWWAGNRLFLAGRFGLAWSSDAGNTWTRESTVEDLRFATESAWAASSDDVMLAGSLIDSHGSCVSGAIVRRVEGRAWQVQRMTPALPSGGELCAMTTLNGNGMGFTYAASAEGLFYRSLDHGVHFGQVAAQGAWKSVLAIHAGSGSNVWVLAQPKQPPASKPRLWFSHDAGSNFADFPPPANEGKIIAIGGSQAGELVVAQNGHVYECTPEAITWSELTNGAFAASSKITALAVPAPHHVIAVGDQGVILDIRPESGKL